MCHHCGYRQIAPGKQKYCHECASTSKTAVRRERRNRLKEQGVPIWKRNGFASAEAFRSYYRNKMRYYRAEQKRGAL